ncbi:MAG: MBL fold metallo-hydrolase [Leptothrix sp. (in: b-proteobacteria)]
MSQISGHKALAHLTRLFCLGLSIALLLGGCVSRPLSETSTPAEPSPAQITILYDAFGRSEAMQKDWGYAALVEVSGKRILFDTGNDPGVFAHNVRAAGVDLTNLDFVVMSHRHGDHMAGLNYLLSVNPKVKIYAPKEVFGVFGGSLPGSFYRRDETLSAESRYYDGQAPELMRFGNAWPQANLALVDQTTEVAPGVTLIALVSDAPGTRELKELSLAINTPQGLVLVVGCSHPGIQAILTEAVKINPHIHFVAGGFHLVVAADAVIDKVSTALFETFKVDWIAPGHCTGEPTFTALRKLFGQHYLYAGLGTVLSLDQRNQPAAQPSDAAELAGDDLSGYLELARRSPDVLNTAPFAIAAMQHMSSLLKPALVP